MNTILNIFRWFLGMLFGFTLFVSVFVLIPLSVIGKQVFVKEVGMQWLDAFASNEELVTQTVDGIFDGIATSNTLDEPALKELAKFAADKNSPFGSALRQVLTPSSIRENLLRNGELFYKWMESDSVALEMRYTLGGGETAINNAVSTFLKVRYEGLSACTATERKDLGKVDANNIATVSCSVGPIGAATFASAAKKMTSTPEAKEIIKNGFVIASYAEGSDKGKTTKTGILNVKKTAESGLFLTWCLILFSVLLMALLFTPMGINFIASGVIVGTTGLSIASMGLAISREGIQLKETLGQPISMQGVYLVLLGFILVILGIWQLIKSGKDEQKNEQQPIKEELKRNRKSNLNSVV